MTLARQGDGRSERVGSGVGRARWASGMGSLLALGLFGAAGCGDLENGGSQGAIAGAREPLGQVQQGAGAVTCVTLKRGNGKAFDAMISSEKVATNYGGSTVALVGQSSSSPSDSFLALFRFDTSTIPVNATITSATLALSQLSPGPGSWNAHLITAPWNEATVTWQSFGNAFNPAVFKSVSIGTASVVFDVAPQLQAWVNGSSPNHGLVIEQLGGGQSKIKTAEWAVPGARPFINACYTVACAPNFADCNGVGADGCEANLASVANCGACGNVCALAHATPSCSAGACAVGSCDPGWGDCDGAAQNGCETDLGTSSDCGACSVLCALPGAAASCAAGSCKIESCNAGFFDCDGNPQNGCEPSPCADGGHCASGAECASQVCAAGLCAPPTCSDHTKNGGESGVDCGGACSPCADGEGCGGGVDCQSGVCAAGVCAAPSCADGVKNGSETGVDCGGICAVPEACNGVDDDCNGLVDEGLGTITCGVGACQVTQPSCAGGQPQLCVPGAPSAEICDGLLDDDCDGVVDDGCECVNGSAQGCYTGAAATANVGACHGGMQTCSLGHWGACAGEVTPAAETCDGLDNDCNGQVDEGLGTVSCGQGVCLATVASCANGQAQVCSPGQPSAEACDGLDNDCDGVVDDGAAASCAARANSTASCSASACVYACNAGFGNCDGAAANGCELNLTSDANNCGSCGHVCGLGWSCAAGACVNNTLSLSYAFDGTATDLSGNGFTGTILGASFVAGKHGQALNFNGGQVVAALTSGTSPLVSMGTGSFTLAAWIRNTNGGGIWKRIITRRFNASGWYSLAVDANRLRLELAAGVNYNGSAIVGDSQWHHVAAVRTNNGGSCTVQLFVDGVLDGQWAGQGCINVDNPGNILVGNWCNNSGTGCEAYDNGNFKGDIDDVRIFKAALSQAQIQSLM
jgi:hypothetical protein